MMGLFDVNVPQPCHPEGGLPRVERDTAVGPVVRSRWNGNLTLLIFGTRQQKDALTANTPLWFYALREAELNGGRLTGVGGRIVAEVFHRAAEGMLRDRHWRPSLGPDKQTFRMVELLLFAFEGRAELRSHSAPRRGVL